MNHKKLKNALSVWLVASNLTGCLLSFHDWPEEASGGQGGEGGSDETSRSGSRPSGGSASRASGLGGAITALSAHEPSPALGHQGGSGSSSYGASNTGGNAAGAIGGSGALASHSFGGSNSQTSNTSAGSTNTNTVWLALQDDTAPNALPPNSTLGIEGRFYVTQDPCAQVDYDPITRCLSGHTCSPDEYPSAWGVSLNFAFSAQRDALGNSITQVWDPEGYGVVGVAWSLSGTKYPGLQLWVLSMDPLWNGSCSSDSCDINGPPYGAPQAGKNGTLMFSSMRRDYWGGTGENYSFDPAFVMALQFKIPAVNVGAADFAFCISELGLIRR